MLEAHWIGTLRRPPQHRVLSKQRGELALKIGQGLLFLLHFFLGGGSLLLKTFLPSLSFPAWRHCRSHLPFRCFDAISMP
jgi:hypothetical protein